MDPSSEPPRSASIAAVTAMNAATTDAASTETNDSEAATNDASASITNEHVPDTARVAIEEHVMAASHLARFEFSDHGTKVLMVEWYPGAAAAPTMQHSATAVVVSKDVKQTSGAEEDSSRIADPASVSAQVTSPDVPASSAADTAVWEVSWPGKKTVLPARDTDSDGTRRRVYFMLPPNAPVPATVTVARPGRTSLILKPLPAIFPERFDAESGPRGVLHTIWAKKRLIELEREMEAELRTNAESVGLEMALAEKQWIVENFLRVAAPPIPMSPRSPSSGRLGDKLKGLRLATSPADLVPSPTANTFTNVDSQSQTLSPLGGDIAVSSFSAISSGQSTAQTSLDTIVQGNAPTTSRLETRDAEDDLFALPMSPRSPDMKRSPFSALGVGP